MWRGGAPCRIYDPTKRERHQSRGDAFSVKPKRPQFVSALSRRDKFSSKPSHTEHGNTVASGICKTIIAWNLKRSLGIAEAKQTPASVHVPRSADQRSLRKSNIEDAMTIAVTFVVYPDASLVGAYNGVQG